jgi:hypothetical protein
MPPHPHHHDGHGGHQPRPFFNWDWPQQPQYTTYVVDSGEDETPKWVYVLAGVLLGLLIRGN